MEVEAQTSISFLFNKHMSQVKKLQVGGKFIIDGQEIIGDDAVKTVDLICHELLVAL